MATETTNYNFIKDDLNENYNIDKVNANLDKIDAEIKTVDNNLVAHKAEYAIQVSTGTANAITVSTGGDFKYTQGNRLSFKAISNSISTVTVDVDGKGTKILKKLDGSNATVKAGKVYEVYFDTTNDCFFQLARAEGDAVAGNVLAGKTFSNDDDTGIVGTIPTKTAQTYTPSTSNQTIASGQFLSGIQTISGDANLVSSNIKSGISIFGKAGSHIFSFIPGINMFAQTGTSSVSREGTTPIELYGMTVYHSGIIRTKFSLGTSSTGYTAYGRIYVNGVAKGVIRSTTSTNSVEFTEDVVVGANDVVSLYVWVSDSTNYAYSYGMSLSMGYSMPFFTNYPV